MDVLESVFSLSPTKNRALKKRTPSPTVNLPKSVEEAVDSLVSEMSLKDKVIMANMNERDLDFLHFTIGHYIRETYGLWVENKELMESCRLLYGLSGNDDLHVDQASLLIINELWKKWFCCKEF